MSFNLATMLRESARRQPDKAAVICGPHRMTYAELDATSDRLAVGPSPRGLGLGEAGAPPGTNPPHLVVAYFGILKAGCVVVPMNVMFKSAEAAHVLRDSGARLLITWPGSVEHATKAAADVGLSELFVVSVPGQPRPEVGKPFEQLLAAGPAGPRPMAQSDPGEPAVIIYTSGTTGRPKGAELTHFQLFMNAETPGRVFGIRADDLTLVVLPLFHVFGMSSLLNVGMRFGATLTLVPRFE